METVPNKYRFFDFTLKNYQKLLQIALEEFRFIEYKELNNQIRDKFILLRHDVEFSVPIALEMAKIEAELGIKASLQVFVLR
jgi:hypothetical protein